jgi:hypothetical protein
MLYIFHCVHSLQILSQSTKELLDAVTPDSSIGEGSATKDNTTDIVVSTLPPEKNNTTLPPGKDEEKDGQGPPPSSPVPLPSPLPLPLPLVTNKDKQEPQKQNDKPPSTIPVVAGMVSGTKNQVSSPPTTSTASVNKTKPSSPSPTVSSSDSDEDIDDSKENENGSLRAGNSSKRASPWGLIPILGSICIFCVAIAVVGFKKSIHKRQEALEAFEMIRYQELSVESGRRQIVS